jgi:hypothetical protein
LAASIEFIFTCSFRCATIDRAIGLELPNANLPITGKHARLVASGGIWAASCECKPIRDWVHFRNVFNYILNHQATGAVVYQQHLRDEMEDFNPDDLLIE